MRSSIDCTKSGATKVRDEHLALHPQVQVQVQTEHTGVGSKSEF